MIEKLDDAFAIVRGNIADGRKLVVVKKVNEIIDHLNSLEEDFLDVREVKKVWAEQGHKLPEMLNEIIAEFNSEISDKTEDPDAVLKCDGHNFCHKKNKKYGCCGSCYNCNPECLQIKDLTAEQARRWLDKGILVGNQTSAVCFKHENKYWFCTKNESGGPVFSPHKIGGLLESDTGTLFVIGPAVERRERLKASEAIRLYGEGWRVAWTGPEVILDPEYRKRAYHIPIKALEGAWSAERRNYKLPEGEAG